MKAVMTNKVTEKLIPVLSEKERQEIILYYTCSEKYEKSIAEKVLEDLKKHPVFGKMIESIPKEVQEENNKISKALLKDGIYHNNWEPYIEYQVMQGTTYAKLGYDFKVWYELIGMARNYLTPCFYEEFGHGEDLLSALNGMNNMLDISMGIIGEAYLQEKKDIIEEDNKQIKKLNDELEQKVLERTNKLDETINRLKENEEELLQSNKLFSELFEHNPASIVISTLDDSKMMKVNETFLEMFGYKNKEEVIGKTAGQLNIWTDTEKRVEMVKQLKADKKVSNYEIQIQTAQGQKKWVSSSILIIEVEKVPCLLAVSIDITSKKMAEDQLISVNKELEAFSYSVSHDLRAPLRAVDGYAKMLEEDYIKIFDTEGKRFLEMIQYNAKKMSGLIDDLLAFSRLGRKEVQKTELNMNDLVEGALIDMNKTTKHNCKINVAKLHSAMGDYALINQVMVNLISNGVKYSSKKKNPQVDISSELKGREVVYTVKDNGAGFNMKYAHKLFGVFQRLHSVEEFEGTGVGLAIVQRIINKHGGKVQAVGESDKGASFSFTLPTN